MSRTDFDGLIARMNHHPKDWNDVHKRIKDTDVVALFGGMPELYTVPELYKDTRLPSPGTVFRRATYPSMFILRTPKGHEYLVGADGANYARNAAIFVRSL